MRDSSERLFFIILLSLHLLPVWAVKFFLTTDGPCHLYNSKVLLDLASSCNTDFYYQYYSVNTNLDPNWFGHTCLAFLQIFLPGFLAEKVFLSAYIILFVVTIRFLIKLISRENIFLSWMALPFIYNHALQLGFYNSLFSIVLMLMIVFVWLKPIKNPIVKILLSGFLFTLLYFTHLLGLAFALFFISILIPWWEGWWNHSFSDFFKNISKRALQLIVVSLPALLLALNYFNKVGTGTSPSYFSSKKLYHDFIELSSLISMSGREKLFPMIVSILFGCVLIYVVYRRIQNKKILKADGFLICFFAALIVYFKQPGGIAGGFILQERLQTIPFLIILPWFAAIHYDVWMKRIVMLGISVASLTLILIRMPHHIMASDAVKEITSVGKFIEDKSTVLPLSFSFNGKTTEGKYIANSVWLFTHAADYLGAEKKSFVLLGNYEANTGYFPLRWKPDKNPFWIIGEIEGLPPKPDIIGYQPKSGGTIDYVLILFLDSKNEFINHPATENLMSQLNDGYKLIFTSQNGRAKLYKSLNN